MQRWTRSLACRPLLQADFSDKDAFDSASVMAAAEFLSHDGRHWLYYMGCPYKHEKMNPKNAI